MENSLTEGNVVKKLMLFAVPIFLSNLLQAMYGTVDLLIVGKFADAAAVSAVSTGSMTMQTIMAITFGLTMGATILIGQSIGAKNFKTATRTVATAISMFIVLGFILAFVIGFTASLLASVMNAPEEAFSQTVSYIRTCGIGVVFIVLFNALGGIYRGIGDSKTPLILVAIACVCNIIGDLILVKGFGLGAFGAALATVAAQAVSVFAAAILMKKRGPGFETDPKEFHFAKQECRMILKYGIPVAAQEALTGVSFMIILAILNTFGLVASAGVGIAEKICGLIFIVPGAFMAAVSSFSAQNFGAGKKERALRGMFAGMVVSVAVGLVMFGVTFFNGAALAGIFSDDLEVCLASADYLRSYAIDCVAVGINFCMMGYLNGLGETRFVALQGILSTFLVRIPFSYFMSLREGTTLFQVGFATPMATFFAIIITVAYMLHISKKKNSAAANISL